MASLAQVGIDSALSDPENTPPAEAELVLQAQAGDDHAFGDLVRLYERRVFNFLCQMTRHRQDAEDLAQQTFIKAYKNLHRFDVSRPLAGWLLTIARRTALNHFRSAKKWEEIPASAASTEPSPASQVEAHDAVDDIWDHARRRLSQRSFQIMWLRYGENLSIAETARVVGLTQAHVKILVFRARRRLQQCLQHHETSI